MKQWKRTFLAAIALVALGGSTLAVPGVRQSIGRATGSAAWERRAAGSVAQPRPGPRVQAALEPGAHDVIRLPGEVAFALKMRTTASKPSADPLSLPLMGSLALDPNRLARVHPRFGGEVVEIGAALGGPDHPERSRPIRFGDEVKEGQLLAVLWSTELGEKKSEYVDALSRLRMERETLTRLEKLFKDEAIPERNLREARRNVEAAEIAVVRVERTLQSWRLTDEEIAGVRTEAEQMRARPGARDKARERTWARLEVRAPFAGTVVEKNVALGDIVETTTDLFKVADLRRLSVWAHVYEEDLPPLLKLPMPIRWTIRLKSEPAAEPLSGTVEEIGDIIDPSQHTALVMGYVDNPNDRLRAGQFILATVALPPDPGEVEVPTSALVEDGDECVVFVQPDPAQPVYSLRHVTIVRHTSTRAFVRGSGAKGPTLKAGDPVVSSGALELRAALRDLQAAERESKAR